MTFFRVDPKYRMGVVECVSDELPFLQRRVRGLIALINPLLPELAEMGYDLYINRDASELGLPVSLVNILKNEDQDTQLIVLVHGPILITRHCGSRIIGLNDDDIEFLSDYLSELPIASGFEPIEGCPVRTAGLA